MKRFLLAAGLGLVMLGCSGDQPPDPLTQSDYSVQGNAICDQMNADLDALSLRLSAGVSPEDERDIFVEAREVSRRAIDELFELEPPPSLIEERQSLLELAEERRVLIERTISESTDFSDEILVVSQQFELEARVIWPRCTTS